MKQLLKTINMKTIEMDFKMAEQAMKKTCWKIGILVDVSISGVHFCIFCNLFFLKS